MENALKFSKFNCFMQLIEPLTDQFFGFDQYVRAFLINLFKICIFKFHLNQDSELQF